MMVRAACDMTELPGCDELAEFVRVVVGSIVGDQNGWDTVANACFSCLISIAVVRLGSCETSM